MKILNYKLRGEMIVVQTDSDVLPEVVYNADRYPDLESLKNEINKKITEVESHSLHKALRKENLTIALDASTSGVKK